MGTPAVGSQISVTQVYNFLTGSNPSAGSSIAFRSTLGPLRQPAVSGSATNVGLSSTFGGQDISYTISSSSGSVSEGSSLTFTINTTYVPNGTTLYYKLAGINTRDLDDSNYSYTNTTYTSSGAAGYAAIVNKTYNRLLGRYPESTAIVDYWVNNFLSGNYSSLNQFFSDFTSSTEYASLEAVPTETGTVTTSSGSASKTFLVTPDYLTEGTESVTFEVRTGSQSGTLVGSSIVSLSDTYVDEGFPTINSFTTSSTSATYGGSITLSWSTTNANVVRLFKDGAFYKQFDASTTSVVETINDNCNFRIYAWNGTNAAVSGLLSIVTWTMLRMTIGAGGAGGVDVNAGSGGSSTQATFMGYTVTGSGGGGGGYNIIPLAGGSGGGGSGSAVYSGGSGAGAAGDTGGGGGGGINGSSAPVTANSGGDGAASGSSIPSALINALNAQYGNSVAGLGHGTTSNSNTNNNNGNPGTGWGAGGGGANWWGGNGGNGILGGGGGGAAGYTATNRTGGSGGGGIVVAIYTISGTPTAYFYTSTQDVNVPSNTSAVEVYAIGGGGGGGGSSNIDAGAGAGGGAGGTGVRTSWPI